MQERENTGVVKERQLGMPISGQLKKEYALDCKHGASVTISATYAFGGDEDDKKDIVSSFAQKSRMFYFALAEMLSNMP